MELGKQIKVRRAELGLSQDELAEQIYVSRQTISNWENDKSYPDIKSLLLLSTLFHVSLDELVKGDLEKMKEHISEEDVAQFNRDSTIFSLMLLCTLLLPFPLLRFLGKAGIGIWALFAGMGFYYATRVERHKKNFDIQTYREILAFSEGTPLSAVEKQQEFGKRPYQKFLIVLGCVIISLLVSIVMFVLL